MYNLNIFITKYNLKYVICNIYIIYVLHIIFCFLEVHTQRGNSMEEIGSVDVKRSACAKTEQSISSHTV